VTPRPCCRYYILGEKHEKWSNRSGIDFFYGRGCASKSPEISAIEDPILPANERVLTCLFQWDFMLYSFQARKQGLDRERFENYLLEEYTKNINPKDNRIIETAVKNGVSEIYTAEAIESNFLQAFSGSIHDGFKSCLDSQGVASFENQLKGDIQLAQIVTLIAAAKNRGMTKAQMIEQYGGVSEERDMVIQHVYSRPDFNAGSFRLTLWAEAVKAIE
jgi:hypothetical protein